MGVAGTRGLLGYLGEVTGSCGVTGTPGRGWMSHCHPRLSSPGDGGAQPRRRQPGGTLGQWAPQEATMLGATTLGVLGVSQEEPIRESPPIPAIASPPLGFLLPHTSACHSPTPWGRGSPALGQTPGRGLGDASSAAPGQPVTGTLWSTFRWLHGALEKAVRPSQGRPWAVRRERGA